MVIGQKPCIFPAIRHKPTTWSHSTWPYAAFFLLAKTFQNSRKELKHFGFPAKRWQLRRPEAQHDPSWVFGTYQPGPPQLPTDSQITGGRQIGVRPGFPGGWPPVQGDQVKRLNAAHVPSWMARLSLATFTGFTPRSS